MKNMFSFLIRFFVIILIIQVFGEKVEAAEIKLYSPTTGQWQNDQHVKLEGKIEKGDYKKLYNLMRLC